MEKKAKLKMSNHTFRRILIPIMVLTLVLCLIVNVACSVMAATLDTYVGAGSPYISGGKSGLDGNYYTNLYDNGT